MPPKHGQHGDDHDGPQHGGAQHGGAQHGGAQHGGAQHGGRQDKGASELIEGRGHGGDGGRPGAVGGGAAGQNMSPELRRAVETARQDRVELDQAAPENKAQCAEALKNSEAEVVRLGGSLSMLGEGKHTGGPGDGSDKGADELIGGRGGHQGGGGRGGRGGHGRD